MAITITGTAHDMGAKDVTISRATREEATNAARLMGECGYRTVLIDGIDPSNDHQYGHEYLAIVAAISEAMNA